LPVITPPNSTNVPGQENTTVTLDCQVAPLDSLSDLYWTKNGVRLNTSGSSKYSGGTKSIPNLTINSMTDSDVGRYECVSTNNFGTTEGPNITVNLEYKPQLNVSSGSIVTTPGNTISITCTVSANPNISSFYWSKVGSGLINPSSNTNKYIGGTVANSTLTITGTQTQDSGKYTCTAGNTIGNTTSSFVSLLVTLLPVITPPNSTNVPGQENTTVTLDCQVAPLDSLSDLYWTKNGVRLNTSGSSKYSGGTKSIPNLTINSMTDSDVGRYECVSTNNFGTTEGPNITVNLEYKPQLNVSSGSIVTTPGNTISITCTVSANPNISSFYWSKVGSGLINPSSNTNKYIGGTVANSTLTITGTQTQDSGKYTCTAGNTIGNTTSSFVSLLVTLLPVITPPNSTNVPGQENTTVTLDCQVAPLDSLSDLYWTKNGVRLNTSGSSKYSGGTKSIPNLTINSMTDSDVGRYECVSTNNFGTTEGPNITVNLKYKPQLNVSSGSIVTTPGNTISLTCTVSANPNISSFYWSKVGSGLINPSSNTNKYIGGTVANSTLTITGTQTQDSGNYTCTAGNTIGNTTSSFVSLLVTLLPVITPPNSTNVPGQENTTVTLDCQVAPLDSLSDLYWTKNGVRLNTTGSSKYSGGTKSIPNLTINSMTDSDVGRYECVSTNNFGTTEGPNLTVNLKYKPQLNVSSGSIVTTPGNTISITCTVSANPNISSFYWSKVGSGLINPSSNTNKYIGGTVANSTLTITGTQTQDSGKYTCTAGNTIGNTTSSFVSLLVTLLPVITPPNSTNVPGQENTTVTLDCQVAPLDSLSDLYWTKNGVRLNTSGSSKYSGGTKSIPNLTINSMTDSDVGRYKCVSTNNFGTTEGPNITVNLEYKPQLNVSSGSIVTTPGNTISLTCTVSANPNISSFYWSKVGSGLINPSSNTNKYIGGTVANSTLTITGTQTQDSGNYTCTAGNTIGNTTSSFVSLLVTLLPVITPPNSTNVPGQENTTVTLDCQVAPLDSLSDLYWTKNGVRLNTTGSSKYSGGTKSIPNLTINSMTDSDVGRYECVSTNNFGTTEGPNITVNLEYKPQLNVSSGSIVTTPGNTISITCTVSANPNISSFYWSKVGSGLINPSSNTNKYIGGTVANSTLTITGTQTQDSGNYTCTAGNTIGNTTSSFVSLLVTLLPVITPPNSTNVPGQENTTVTLDCQVAPLDSLSDLYWTKNGVRLNTTGSSKYSGGTKSIPNLTINSMTDSYVGRYECVSTNNFGTTEGPNITVNLEYKPQLNVSSGSIVTTPGNTISLTCTVSANPNISSFYWSKVGSGLINPSSNTNKYIGGTVANSTLTITGTQTQDSGNYTCTAGNTIGNTASSFVSLLVTLLPVITPPNSTNVPGQENTTVTLDCQVAPLDSLSDLYWTKNGVRLNTTGSSKYSGGTKSIPNLTINSMTDSDVGRYECVAVNSFGTNEGPNLTVSLQYKPRLNVSTGSITSPVGSTVSLTCTVSSNPSLSSFYWTKIGSGLLDPSSNTSKYSGGTISNTALTISGIQVHDSGNYTCSAGNTIGNTTSSFVSLLIIISVQQSIVSQLQYSSGDTFNITCDASKFSGLKTAHYFMSMSLWRQVSPQAAFIKIASYEPLAEFNTTKNAPSQWQVNFSGGEGFSNRNIMKIVVTVVNYQCTDAGLYKCQAVLPSPSTNYETTPVNLTAKVGITQNNISMTPHNQAEGTDENSSVSSVGEEITMTCTFTGPANLQAFWKRNDEDYPYPNNITNSNPSSSVVSGCNTYTYSSELKFTLEESDNGNTYICVVTERNNEWSRKMFNIEVLSIDTSTKISKDTDTTIDGQSFGAGVGAMAVVSLIIICVLVYCLKFRTTKPEQHVYQSPYLSTDYLNSHELVKGPDGMKQKHLSGHFNSVQQGLTRMLLFMTLLHMYKFSLSVFIHFCSVKTTFVYV
ncbi:hemicentin-1, partial [Biomphalaria pfeifferi]